MSRDTSYWSSYLPPELPEQRQLEAAIERARQLTPAQVLAISIRAGIHNVDGSLTIGYRQ